MSTGWLAGWLGVNNWGLSVRDQRALQEIWGRRPGSAVFVLRTDRTTRADGPWLLAVR